MSLFAMWFYLSVGAVAYQALTYHDWTAAFTTSWDQAVALGFVWFVRRKFFILSRGATRWNVSRSMQFPAKMLGNGWQKFPPVVGTMIVCC
jgi:hypothetical protein